jgi:putative ABC transport system permease protein
MYLRIVKDSFARQPRRKLLAAAALALGTAMATATLSVALDVGDRMAREFRSLGANVLVRPLADTLPLEIGGVDYRPVDSGAYLQVDDLGGLKTIFWRNNIIGFAPFLEMPVELGSGENSGTPRRVTLIGTWYQHEVTVPDDGSVFSTGVGATHPWWSIAGRWFEEGMEECVVGAALAEREGIAAGQVLELSASGGTTRLTVTGVLSSGGQEDEAILVPLSITQRLSGRPGQYRRLFVSVLTKPEDDFSRRDRAGMTPAEFDRWYCSPYISSISHQIGERLSGTEVRPIRQVAEGEGQILSRLSGLMWLVTLAALMAAAIAVAATAGTTVLERAREIGLMKALGARRTLVGVFFLGEQWLLALAGGTIGYAAGLGLAQVAGQQIFGIAPEIRIILFPVVLALAGMVATVGSLAALRRLLRIDPARVLRGEYDAELKELKAPGA